MNKWTIISSDDESYQLSAIIIKGKYTMPSLIFNLDGEEVECWDNDYYLYKTVYPYLKGEEESDELDKVFCNVKETVLELFEEAIKTGFFHEQQN